MKNIVFNVKKEALILDRINDMQPWDLFNKLGDMVAEEGCKLVSSPTMTNRIHCKQPRDTYDLFHYRRDGKTPTVSVSTRRGYSAVTFSMK